jgi:hypothetical protein
MAAASASSGASPGCTMSETQLRLFCNSFGQDAADLSVPGQRMDFSAESTPACATDDLRPLRAKWRTCAPYSPGGAMARFAK